MASFEWSGRTVSWEGDELTEETEVTVTTGLDPEGRTMPFSRLVAMTNGDVLEALDDEARRMV